MADALWHEERLLIDGELVAASGGRKYENVNPATEEVIGLAADASVEDVKRAIAAARRAFDETSWSRDPELRARCLRQLQAAIRERLEEFRSMLVAEVGTPVLLTYGPQLNTPVDAMSWLIGFLEGYDFHQDLGVAEAFGSKSHRWIEREAIGVVAAITAWNFPIELNLKKLGGALAAGNTVVLKGAPATPWSTLNLGQLVAEHTDIPPGVVNTITSSQNDIGEALTSDPRVDMVTFTGSTATGRRILAAAAPTVKKVTLELGGKSANIALEDADLARVAGASGAMVCGHAGQGCAMLTRFLVPRARLEEAVAIARAAMESVKYGDPTDPQNLMGPLCSARQRERVEGYIRKGQEEGARLVTGGRRPAHLPRGYFVEPTLFADVDPEATIAQEEIFGPVLSIIAYDDEDHAVAIANNSQYGLSGGVNSADLERAKRVARRLRTGTVMVNGGIYYGPEVPFGGYRQSGLGREFGREGFEEFLEVKSLAEPA